MEAERLNREKIVAQWCFYDTYVQGIRAANVRIESMSIAGVQKATRWCQNAFVFNPIDTFSGCCRDGFIETVFDLSISTMDMGVGEYAALIHGFPSFAFKP